MTALESTEVQVTVGVDTQRMCTLLQPRTNWAVSWQPSRCRQRQPTTGTSSAALK